MKFQTRFYTFAWLACATVAANLAASPPVGAVPLLTKVFADYSATPYTFTVDSSKFTFSGTGDPFNPTVIQTAGGAEVNSFGGFLGIPVQPTTNFIDRGTVVFGPGAAFSAFPTSTNIPYSNGNNFIGLLAISNGQSYYGYAFTTNAVLNSFAFETTPNTAITASAAVPEPASWAMLIGGLSITGGAMRIRKKAMPKFA